MGIVEVWPLRRQIVKPNVDVKDRIAVVTKPSQYMASPIKTSLSSFFTLWIERPLRVK